MKIKILEREHEIEEKKMPSLNQIGEKKIIELLQPYLDSLNNSGKNEDAFLYTLHPPYGMINIDTMSRYSDFLPRQTYYQIGMKLVTLTFSDLAAKGATPDLFLSSLITDELITTIELEKIAKGIKNATKKYNTKYIGGDLGSAKEAVFTGIGLGTIRKGTPIPRNGAHVGDLIYVTNSFGLTSIALSRLLETNNYLQQIKISEEIEEMSLNALYEPEAQIKTGQLLSANSLASSCIDSSDGLAISLHWLAQLSQKGILIEKIPINPLLDSQIQSKEEKLHLTMFGGEEYELVFTVPITKEEDLIKRLSKNKISIIKIGQIIKNEGVFTNYLGGLTSIPRKGWDSFTRSFYQEI